MKCSLIVPMIAALALPAVAAEISNVSIVQERPFSTDVRITYDLAGLTGDESIDVALSCTADGAAVTPAEAGLSGDLRDVHGNGTHQIRLDPKAAFGDLGARALLKFRVSLTAEPASEKNKEVLYKIFDLSEKSVTDVSRGALLNGAYGSVETDFGRIGPGYTTTLDDVLIWTGVTNDIAYKTTKLVLRKIPSGEFKSFRLLSEMTTAPNASLAYDYWIGVFELTQGQESRIGKGTRNDFLFVGETLPVQQATLQYAYYNLNQIYMKDHSSTNEDWLANSSNSLLYKLANLFKSGDTYPYDFELPTQVQWMRAMRAGADSFYYDGLPEPDNVESNAQMDVLARYRYNGGLVDNGDGTVTTNIAQVGSCRPNAYGLYDMLGNVRELCREHGAFSKDQWKAGGENPLATVNGLGLVRWGGGFQDGGRASYVEDSIDRGISYETGNLHTKNSTADPDRTRLGMRICMMTMADGKKYFSPDHVNQPKE